jgi:acetoin:2,6-dichlorophenolindophenol oxidoreductase subunit beta
MIAVQQDERVLLVGEDICVYDGAFQVTGDPERVVGAPISEVGAAGIAFGKAQLKLPARDLTIIATSIMVHRSLDAERLLAKEGIQAEVIDLRSLRPLDTQTLVDSVKRTHRLLCVCEGARTLGIGAKISATIAESEALDHLDAPIIRLGGAECPIPYTPELERASVPQTEAILAAARRLAAARI